MDCHSRGEHGYATLLLTKLSPLLKQSLFRSESTAILKRPLAHVVPLRNLNSTSLRPPHPPVPCRRPPADHHRCSSSRLHTSRTSSAISRTPLRTPSALSAQAICDTALPLSCPHEPRARFWAVCTDDGSVSAHLRFSTSTCSRDGRGIWPRPHAEYVQKRGMAA